MFLDVTATLAPQLWVRHVWMTLEGLDYTDTTGPPGVYHHKEKDVEITLQALREGSQPRRR